MNKTFTIIVMLLISGMTGTVFAGFTTQQLTNDALVDTVPTIAVGSDGVAHIAWYHNAEIFYSTFSNGVFGAPTNVSNMSGDDLRPCIAVDNNGHVHIAWHHYRGNIYYANNSSGSFVTQAVAYSYYGCKPSLALDSTNTPHITWGDYGTNGIHYASGDFSNEITLPGTTGDDEDPAIGVDSGDYVHIIWENNALYYTNNVSGTFADPTSIGGGGDAPPNMEFDSGDHIHIAFTKSYSMVDPPWSQRDVIYGNNVSGSFSFTRMTNTSGNEIHPSVAIDANDKVHLVWQSWSDETLLYTNNLSGSFASPIQIAANVDWDSSYRANADRIIGLHNVSNTIYTVYSDTSSDGEVWIAWTTDYSLPVTLTHFDAILSSQGVTLRWHTETEVNNVGFNIYRSEEKDGDYTKIGRLNGAGNSAMLRDYQFTDKGVEAGKTYFYFFEDVDIAGERSKSETIRIVVPSALPVPKEFRLLQNYPNPFNPETWIPHQLASASLVTISIYNQKGQLIRTINLGEKRAGSYITRDKAAYWDGKNDFGEKVSSGVYFYTLRAGEFKATRQMLIVK